MNLLLVKCQRLLAAVSVVFICATASSARTISDEVLKSALQDRYAAMKFAMAAHNNAAIRSMLAPRFESIDVSGHSSGAAQMIAGLDALQPDPNKVSTTTVLNLSQVGDKITVEQRYDMTTKRTSEAGAVHKVELVTVSMDTWVNPVGVWLLERTVTNSLSIFRDGDLVVHKVKS